MRLGAFRRSYSTKWTHKLSERLANQLYKSRSEPLNAENNNSINYTVYCTKNKWRSTVPPKTVPSDFIQEAIADLMLNRSVCRRHSKTGKKNVMQGLERNDYN